MIDTIFRALGMAGMLFNICTQTPETIKACMTDQHIWLWPEIQRGWELYTEREQIYSDEQETLENAGEGR